MLNKEEQSGGCDTALHNESVYQISAGRGVIPERKAANLESVRGHHEMQPRSGLAVWKGVVLRRAQLPAGASNRDVHKGALASDG